MSAIFKLLYAVGFAPWDHEGDVLTPRMLELVARAETTDPPYGRGLDVGCGRGSPTIQLAKRGWHMTGVDAVPKALRTARQRARKAGVDVEFLQGDVTRLSAVVSPGFDLFLDRGCFHSLNERQRVAVAREQSLLASPGAHAVVLAFQPGSRRGPGPRGATRDDVVDAYRSWTLETSEPVDVPDGTRTDRLRAPQLYLLVKD